MKRYNKDDYLDIIEKVGLGDKFEALYVNR